MPASVRWYVSLLHRSPRRSSNPISTKSLSRTVSVLGATPSDCSNSSKCVCPESASARIRSVHRSPRSSSVLGTRLFLVRCLYLSIPVSSFSLLMVDKKNPRCCAGKTVTRMWGYRRHLAGWPSPGSHQKYSRLSVSATQTGLGTPRASIVMPQVNVATVESEASTETSLAWTRTAAPTGTGAVKRTRLSP